jgi:hypothetical protein
MWVSLNPLEPWSVRLLAWFNSLDLHSTLRSLAGVVYVIPPKFYKERLASPSAFRGLTRVIVAQYTIWVISTLLETCVQHEVSCMPVQHFQVFSWAAPTSNTLVIWARICLVYRFIIVRRNLAWDQHPTMKSNCTITVPTCDHFKDPDLATPFVALSTAFSVWDGLVSSSTSWVRIRLY